MTEDLREKLVWGFYEHRYPEYTQGKAGEHELTELITADEANNLVFLLKSAEDSKDRLANELYDVLFPPEPPEEREVRWKWIQLRARHVVQELAETIALLRDYPKGQDDGSWVKRKDAILARNQ